MSRVLAIAAVVALFIAGIAVGALGTHLYYDHHFAGPGGGPQMLGHRFFMHRLHRQLALTPEQSRQVDRILDRTHQEAAGIREEMRPRVKALMDRAHHDIEAILTPEQREKFQRLLDDSRLRGYPFLLGPPDRRGPPWGGPGRGRGGPPPEGPRPDAQPSPASPGQ
jgi:Spy/CpxP family protein refolding chaperone